MIKCMKINKYISGLFIIFLVSSFFSDISAQSKNDTLFVSGTIVDASTREPIQGALINVSNAFSVLTDELGNYKVQSLSKKSIIRVTAPGYLERIVPLKGNKIVNLRLYSEFFISPDKDANTFTNSLSVSLDDELKTKFASDVRTIKRSGQIGIGSNLFIRGYNSLNATSKPLIVVDGVIWDDLANNPSVIDGFHNNSLNDIDVTDIQSINIVKNANSLYGSKGTNGVIEIRTTRATNPATKITFDASYGRILQPKLTPVLNANQYRIEKISN